MKKTQAFPALLLIDAQEGFLHPSWGRRCNPEFEANLSLLLEGWRFRGAPVFHVQHLSLQSDSPLARSTGGCAFLSVATPRGSEAVFQKNVNSAFIGTGLEPELRRQGVESLVLAGLTTDHCVSTSARMAANLGFRVQVASDATATFGRSGIDGESYPAELVHALSLASLNGEFGRVLPTRELLGRVKGLLSPGQEGAEM